MIKAFFKTKRGADMASDHHLVAAEIKLNLKKHWTVLHLPLQKFYIDLFGLLQNSVTNKQIKRSVGANRRECSEDLAIIAEKA